MSTLRPPGTPAYVTNEALRKAASKPLPEKWAPPPAEARFGWGSISHNDGNEHKLLDLLGIVAPRESYEFLPRLKKSVVDAVLSMLPAEVVPVEGDTSESLALRIARACFFDELAALDGGGRRGRKRRRLNETVYRQPRRISWSVVVEDVHRNDDDTPVRTMYAFGKKNSRIRTHLNATPMPWPVFELGVQCFLSVRHVLAQVCASSPPNHCQMLAYYDLFDSKIGRHKDDHKKKDFHKVLLGFSTPTDAENKSKGAMVPGSDVLVYSAGPLPVLFAWCFTRKQDGHFVKRDMYQIHPYMQLDLPHGSVFVFKAMDDLHFYHEVNIQWSRAKDTDYRFAFVFRWLGEAQLSDFPAAADS